MHFKKLQDDAKKLEDIIVCKTKKDRDTIFILLTHLMGECGETADEIKGMEGRRVENTSDYSKEKLAKELIDIIFNVLRIANLYKLDLDNYWLQRLKEIENKFK